MAINWNELQYRYDQLAAYLVQPDLSSSDRLKAQKEASRLQEMLEKYNELQALEKLLTEAQEEKKRTREEELKQLFDEEITQLQTRIKTIHQDLEELLYPPDERDRLSAFVEVRAGTGGQEAALFASDLLRMYANYALSKRWQVSLIDESPTDLGGIREATLHIQGKGVYGHLKREAGVHRVQRVPKTETSGRVHTSTATVAILPEVKEVDIKIDPADLRIDTYRAGGAGGQHVNRTDSAVRITHIPTGTVAACQEERSQHKNKDKAMKMLQARLSAAEQERRDAELAKERKEMVGGGMRAEKVRTYNFPQNRVTDHQINLTLKNLDMVMQGEALDEIVQALRAYDRELRRTQQEKEITQ